MITKKIIERFAESYPDIYERKFALSSFSAAIVLIMIFIWDIIIGEPLIKLITLGVSISLALGFTLLFLKFHKTELGSCSIGLCIILFLMPLMFFMGDGIYGCTPVWCAFAFMYVGINIKGRKRGMMIVILVTVAVTCYVVACMYPEFLIKHDDMRQAYLDAGASLIGVGFLLYVMILFLIEIYDRERMIAESQKREIESLNDAQNRFFSNMSHEIRTPINTIIGLNEMILREEISDEVEEDAKNIGAASGMLLQLINDILDMSKIEAGQFEVTPIIYDTGTLLSDIVDMVYIRAKEKGLQFHIDIDSTLPSRIFGDEMRIKQIIINLLTNAIKYTKEGSVTFTVSLGKKEGRKISVIFNVSDTGIGIRKESIPHLFTAFKRVDVDKNRYIEGTGLGLAIVKQYVDMLGGTITVNSVYTQGSTFIVEIPQEIADSKEVGDLDLEERHELNARVHYKRSFEAPDARVLVVDDSPSNILVVTKLLRDTKVQIDTAKSGEEALGKTFANKYHVIFMDHLMPGMDGIECMHKIREQVGGLSADSKMIALTANAGSEDRLMYTREGFDGYLSKPVTGEDLEHELMVMLPREMVKTTEVNATMELDGESRAGIRIKRLPILISTDSTCDLTADIIKKFDISVIPYYVRTSEGIFMDGVETDSRELINYIEEKRGEVNSESPRVEEYEAFFAKQLLKANNIIHISMADNISNGYSLATEAAQTFDNVNVVDSGFISGGMGFVVLAAAKMANDGYTPEKLIAGLEYIKQHIHTSFIIQNSDAIYGAGRLRKSIGTIADSILLHPVMTVKHGKIVINKVYFGTTENAKKKYIKDVISMNDSINDDILFVSHAGLSLDELSKIKEEVEEIHPFKRVIFQSAAPAIAVNCGPGSFGLMFMTDRES